MKLTLLTAGFFLCLLISSCEEKILEIIPVVQIEKDMSIEGAGDLFFISFPTEMTGYAASNTDVIYKTEDGGESWNSIQVTSGAQCRGLVFFDELNGICLMNNIVYSTTNGGETWSNKRQGYHIGKSNDGIGVVIDNNYNIYTTSNKGVSFTYTGKLNNVIEGTLPKVMDDRVMIYSTFYEKIIGFHLKTKENFTSSIGSYPYYSEPTDYKFMGDTAYIVGHEGLLAVKDPIASRDYYAHTYTYYSVDVKDGFVVGVGENTITSNIYIIGNDPWNEFLTPEGNSFDQTFYKVKIIDDNRFYVSGDNGKILKIKL